MDDELHFGMPGGSGDYKDEGDKSNERDAIPTTCRRRWAATDLERIDLVTSDDKRFQGDNGDNADANEEEEASQADDVSMQNVGDWGIVQESVQIGQYISDLYNTTMAKRMQPKAI